MFSAEILPTTRAPIQLHSARQSVSHSPIHRFQRLVPDADGTLFDFDRAENPGKSGGIEPDLLRVQAAGDFDGSKKLESRGSNCSALRRNFNLPSTLRCNISLIGGIATDSFLAVSAAGIRGQTRGESRLVISSPCIIRMTQGGIDPLNNVLRERLGSPLQFYALIQGMQPPAYSARQRRQYGARIANSWKDGYNGHINGLIQKK
jgi:hypothetical protein